MNVEDAVLIKLLWKNKDEAISLIYRQYWKDLFLYIFSLTKNKSLTEDILQETFLNLWKYKDSVQITDSILAYLKSSSRNYYYKWLKKNNRTAAGVEDAEDLPAKEDTGAKIEFDETQAKINFIIKKMPLQMKDVFLLRKESGLSYKQIGEKMNIAEGTVKKQLYYALKLIKKYI